MNISKDSWHYRLAYYNVVGLPSNSLCIYFRQVVWALFLKVLCYGGAAIVLGAGFYAFISFMLPIFLGLGDAIVYAMIFKFIPHTEWLLAWVKAPDPAGFMGLVKMGFWAGSNLSMIIIGAAFWVGLYTSFLGLKLSYLKLIDMYESYKDRKYRESRAAKLNLKVKVEPDNLLTSWFKAKHEKICPIIEFV